MITAPVLLMPQHYIESRLRLRALTLAILPFAAASILSAEHLPFKSYTKADGLSTGEVHGIVRDSRGFLWFCSDGGLAFFDGYRFHAYGRGESGLAFPTTNHLLETSGSYWVATNGYGVWRFDPARSSLSSRPLVVRYAVGVEPASNRVNFLFKDHAGRLWAATDGGLFRMDRIDPASSFHRIPLHPSSHTEEQMQVWRVLQDTDGSLWIGTKFGLVRILPSGDAAHYKIQPAQGTDHVYAIFRDKQGRLWLAHQSGIIVAVPQSGGAGFSGMPVPERRHISAFSRAPVSLPVTPGDIKRYAVGPLLKNDSATALYMASDGHIWIGTLGSGLIEFDGRFFRSYGRNQGLNGLLVGALAEDAGGNLWIGGGTGATRLARNGFTNYDSTGGSDPEILVSIAEDREGRLYTTDLTWRISRLDGDRLTAVRPKLPPEAIRSGFGNCRVSLIDHLGDWWIATRNGLCRFSGIKRLEDLAARVPRVYTTADGLSQNDVADLFEDSCGDIWISYFGPVSKPLSRWGRASEKFQHYAERDGLASFDTPQAFLQDKAGNLWIGYRSGGLARYRASRFEEIPIPADRPPGALTRML